MAIVRDMFYEPSRAACERGQTSGESEPRGRGLLLLASPLLLLYYILYDRFAPLRSSDPLTIEQKPRSARLDRNRVLNRDRPTGKGRKERKKEREKKTEHVQGVYGRSTARCRGIVLVCRLWY